MDRRSTPCGLSEPLTRSLLAPGGAPAAGSWEEAFRAQFGAGPTVGTFVTGDGIGADATRTPEGAADELLPDDLAGLIFGSIRRAALPLIGITAPEQMVFEVGGAVAAVIGDALAPVHHATARGANNGLQQAAGLAFALGSHIRDGEPLRAALATWERTWLAFVTRTIAASPIS